MTGIADTCSSTITATVTILDSLPQQVPGAITKKRSFRVYPNPVGNGPLHIESQRVKMGNLTFEVYSMLGQNVLTASLNSRKVTKVPLKDLDGEGLYFYAIRHGEQVLQKGKITLLAP
jgi:hypothetical protein